MKITIISSLFPRQIEMQKKNVANWLTLGFEVISINCADEICQLQKEFPNVKFLQARRNEIEKYGKPLIRFDDILYFAKTIIGSEIVGIVNADISFRNENIYDLIFKEAKGSFLFGSRVDIEKEEDIQGSYYNSGFDFFFFDQKIADIYPEEDFCIGVPWWDYWAPLVPALKGIPIKKLQEPCAYHIKHSIQYRVEDWLELGSHIGKYVPELFKKVNYQIGPLEVLVRELINQKSIPVFFERQKKVNIIATSIAPHGIENQQLAIESWQKQGFNVVSLNTKEEVELLRSSFPEIEFAVVSRDAREKYGKPFVYFDDFIDYFKKTGQKICGIVNSDVHLICAKNLPAFFSSEAQDCLVFGSRIDVDHLGNLQGEMYHMGFDFFFFDRVLLDLFPAEEFCIGQPWWDYWMPLVPAGKGKAIKRLTTPIAYHVKHSINWDPKVRIDLGLRMSKYFRTKVPVTETNMLAFLQYVCRIIHEKSQKISL